MLEFSRYPLAQAKVAHIVAGAGIARGSFYKYFDDLTDACRYHFGAGAGADSCARARKRADAQDAYQLVAAFVEKAENLKWQDFIHMHFTYNEGAIPTPQIDLNLPAEQWLIMLACHDVLRQVAKAPQKRE